LVEQDLVITIPKSSNPQHQQQNLDVFGFALSPEEKIKIDEMGH
jgi:diketogulonate reductase-like aldo/keto reductase